MSLKSDQLEILLGVGFYEDLTKIIFEISSNMHLISSAGHVYVMNCH